MPWAATLEQPSAAKATRVGSARVRHHPWQTRTPTGEVTRWVRQAVTKVAAVMTAVVLTVVAASMLVTRAARTQPPLVTRAASSQDPTAASKTIGAAVVPPRAMKGRGCVAAVVALIVTGTGAEAPARFLAKQILQVASTVTKTGAAMP